MVRASFFLGLPPQLLGARLLALLALARDLRKHQA
jgi:hypothetical protein